MTYQPKLAHGFVLSALLGMAGIAGCLLDSAGPGGRVARFAVNPDFGVAGASGAAGIVPIARTRVRLARAGGAVALDTVITVPQGSESVTLVAAVTVLAANEAFQLTVAFITPAGDTAFRGGPVEVRATSSSTPVQVTLPTTYVGVGANAVGVRITSQTAVIPFNSSVTLTAEAYDAQNQVIPNTPIAWKSLDTALATVPNPAVGTVQGKSAQGNARIVAALLTGPADTLVASVGTSSVLVLSNCDDCNAAILDSFPVNMTGFTFDTMDVSSQTPTVAFLRQYRVVLLFEEGSSPMRRPSGIRSGPT